MSFYRHIPHIMIFASALCLSACVSVLPEPAPAPSIYRLQIDQPIVAAKPNATAIRVDRPAASTYYQTKDIVVSPDGRRLATASGAQWAEVIPIMVQQSLVSSMATSSDIIGLIPTTGARTKLRAHVTIRQFEANFDRGETNPPQAIVYYDVTLSDASSRDLIATYSVRKTVRANEARISSLVSALEDANQAAMADIVTWLEQQTGSPSPS